MQQFLENIHNDIVLKAFPWAEAVPIHFIYIGGLLMAATLIIGWMSIIAMVWIWAERRVAAYIQARVGPNRVGGGWRRGPLRYVLPTGWLQSLADGIKLLTKEDIIPKVANRFLYELAPLLVFAGAFIPFAVLPFSQHVVIADMDLGLFYILAFASLEVIGILMAGWAPNSKWSLYGGMRLAAQMLSYEIPLGLSLLTVVIMAGSLNLTDIILWQTSGVFIWESVNTPWILDWLNWGMFRSPVTFVAFIIFYIAILAETKRAPFDLPEAESELVSGFHTEYSGIRFSYFFLAEYASMYLMCLLGAVVFMGGWHWPFPASYGEIDSNIVGFISERLGALSAGGDSLWAQIKYALAVALWHGPIATVQALWANRPFVLNELFGFLNLLLKSFFLLFVMLWVRWTIPRIRLDQVVHICLKVLLPFALACVLLAGLQAALVPTDQRRMPRGVTPFSEMQKEGDGLEVVPAAPLREEPVENMIDEGEVPPSIQTDPAPDIETEAPLETDPREVDLEEMIEQAPTEETRD